MSSYSGWGTLMYPSMAWKCVHCVCALPEEWISVSFLLLHPSHSLCLLPSLPLSLSLCPSVSPSPTHLMLPPTRFPSFYHISSANTLPCHVGHVMKKWPVRALHRASYFIISRAFLPFTVRLWSPPLPLSLSHPPSLSAFSSSVSLAPLFLLQPHARGRLRLCEGGRKKSLLLFLQSGPPHSPPFHRRSFFFLSLLAGF